MRLLALIPVLVCVLCLGACKESETYGQAESFSRGGASSGMIAADYVSQSKLSASPSKMALNREKFGNRRIAETHNLNIETIPEGLKSLYDRDFQQCLALGCEIVSSNVNAKNSAAIHARIDPKNLVAYLDFLGNGPGDLKSHNVTADDKTLEYIDTDAKIKNLEALRVRLIRLLDSPKAENVDQILRIERELNRVEQQLDSAIGSLRHLQTITGMATVHSRYTVPHYNVEIRYYELKNSFKRAYQGLITSVANVVRFVGGVLPWIPVWVIGLWIFVKAIKFAFGKGFSLLFWKGRGKDTSLENGPEQSTQKPPKKKSAPKVEG